MSEADATRERIIELLEQQNKLLTADLDLARHASMAQGQVIANLEQTLGRFDDTVRAMMDLVRENLGGQATLADKVDKLHARVEALEAKLVSDGSE